MALLEVTDLRVWFPVLGGVLRRRVDDVGAVDGVSFTVEAGQTVGLVGESGSGNDDCGPGADEAPYCHFRPRDLRRQGYPSMSQRQFRPLRSEMQMIFQDPFGSLNPRMTCGAIIGEALEIHFRKMTPAERRGPCRPVARAGRVETRDGSPVSA